MSSAATLASLIAEIHSISAHLKKRAASSQEQDRLLLGAKGLLQTLHERGPQTVPSIAEARNTSRQNVQIMANRLQELGCVEFIPNPNHKKSDLLRLTSRGEELLLSRAQQETEFLGNLATLLGEEDLNTALSLLQRLHSLLTPSRTSSISSQPNASAADSITQNHATNPSRKPTRSPARPSSRRRSEPLFPTTPDDDSLPVNLL